MPSAPDWRSASAYAHVHEFHLREFAWEYLRRNSAYQRDYRTASRQTERRQVETLAVRWDCAFSFGPQRQAVGAPLVWLPQLHPATVLLVPATEPFTGSRSLRSLTPIFRRQANDGEHWIIADCPGRFPLPLSGGIEM